MSIFATLQREPSQPNRLPTSNAAHRHRVGAAVSMRERSLQALDATRSRWAITGGTGFLQTKAIAVSQPNDALEREADAVANRVMSGEPAPRTEGEPSRSAHSQSDLLQRACSGCGGMEEEQETVARATDAAHGLHPAIAGTTWSAQLRAAQLGGGTGLPSQVRSLMEPKFGASFKNVRLHNDTRASEMAQAVQARAFTLGNHLFFKRGEFDPGTQRGQHLIAHELAHVVQQSHLGFAPKILPYREHTRDNPAYGTTDEPGVLVEKPFRDAKKQPWIERIAIEFDGVQHDGPAHGTEFLVPTGTAHVSYHKNGHELPDFDVSVVGGSTHPALGLTDHTKGSKVTRLEGSGYTDSSARPADPISNKGREVRYSASGAGTMNYAVFFKGLQAIHGGPMNLGSHACVHVDFDSDAGKRAMKQINYHSVIGRTVVDVSYKSDVLQSLCCNRLVTGNTRWHNNPCESVKEASCPIGPPAP